MLRRRCPGPSSAHLEAHPAVRRAAPATAPRRPGGPWRMALARRLVSTRSMRSGSAITTSGARLDLQVHRHAGAARPPSRMRLAGLLQHQLGGDLPRVQLQPAGADPRQVQQVVHDALEPLAVLARRADKVRLLLVERPHRLLGAEVDRHPQRGERGAELVRHGGHQVVLQLVEAPQPGDVLQDDGGARAAAPRRWRPGWPRGSSARSPSLASTTTASSNPRGCTAGPLPASTAFADALHALADRRAAPRQRLPVRRAEAEDLSAARLALLTLPLDVEDQHRIGQAVDGGLRGQLRLEQLARGSSLR